eukprot:1413750-Pyramimonas_sp.AAC.1
MESEQVCMQQALDDLLAPRQCSEHLGRRKWSVQEPTHIGVWLLVSEVLWNEHQVVVVHPNVVVVF